MDTWYRPVKQECAIAEAASLSSTIELGAGVRQLVALRMPATWTAASLTFAVSDDGVTFLPLYYGGEEYTVVAAAGAAASLAISLDPMAFVGWAFVRVRSGTAAAAVNQAMPRTITAVTRAIY